MTHICVNKLTSIGSDNGLLPGRHQAIIWTNAGILLIRTLQTIFSEILIEIHTFPFTKMHLKMSSGKWRPFCLGLNVLSTLRVINPSLFCHRSITGNPCGSKDIIQHQIKWRLPEGSGCWCTGCIWYMTSTVSHIELLVWWTARWAYIEERKDKYISISDGYLGLNKVTDNLNKFPWRKTLALQWKFHWLLFSVAQLAINQLGDKSLAEPIDSFHRCGRP